MSISDSRSQLSVQVMNIVLLALLLTLVGMIGFIFYGVAAVNNNSKLLNDALVISDVPEKVRNNLGVAHAMGCSPGEHLYGNVSPNGTKWHKIVITSGCSVSRIDALGIEKEFSGVVMLLR